MAFIALRAAAAAATGRQCAGAGLSSHAQTRQVTVCAVWSLRQETASRSLILSGQRRWCNAGGGGSSSSSSSSSSSQPQKQEVAWWQEKPEEPKNQILRLLGSAQLRAEASESAEVLAELSEGDFLEGMPDKLEPAGGWLLVRAPLEDKIDVMSEKPLEYQDGWIAVMPPAREEGLPELLERAELQLGDKVAARVHVETHPVLDNLKKLPFFKDGLPSWMPVSVAEIYTGRIGGVAVRGRYIVQRPPGAMPERIAALPERIVLPKARAKQTTIAGLLGLGLSLAIGVVLHMRKWAQGEEFSVGRFAYEPLSGWCALIMVFLTPITIYPCYLFSNSQASTVVTVLWMNLLLYNDLFSE
mmetsp:Transcript_50795/g.107793  ORF Transcript_50795/g.107793 Transcript_50795/m.107793 type:complete len:357 (-) Transcript_50795:48-1118(-)